MNTGFADRATSYARRVVACEIQACRYVKAACQRHLDDLQRSQIEAWPYTFNSDSVDRICTFIGLLPHIEGAWAKPVYVEGQVVQPHIDLEDWQVFFLAMIFGWIHKTTGLRRFRRAYLEVARKNAKSTIAAGVALYMLCADGEPGAQVYTLATKKEQARIVWSTAAGMVRKEPEFRALGVDLNTSAIFVRADVCTLQPLARDHGTLDGLNTHCFISDEMHAQKDRGLYDVLDSSTGARSQPLGLGITTAGSDRSGICYEQRSYTIKILNSTLQAHAGMGYKVEGESTADENYFGMIYTLDHGYADGRSDDDWTDERVWSKANPNLGVSVLLDDMRAACRKAMSMTSAQNEFRTKRCNEWVNADTAWMDMRAWDACANPQLALADFAGDDYIEGLDLASKIDIVSRVKLFERAGHYYAFATHYLPERAVRESHNAQYQGWAARGLLRITDGEILDFDVIKDDLLEDAARHHLQELAYDPFQATKLIIELTKEGVACVEMRPTVLNFSEPMKMLEALVISGRFHHDGDPVLTWMVSNVVCHRDAKDNIYPRKEREENKIDGVVATLMALGRALSRQPEQQFQAFFLAA